MANHTGEFPTEREPLDDAAQKILLANMRAGMSIEAQWFNVHEERWGKAGIKAVADLGISPFAAVPGDHAKIQEIARERLRLWPACAECIGHACIGH